MASDSQDLVEDLFETSNCSTKAAEEPSPSAESILNTANEMLSVLHNKRKFDHDVDSFGELVKAEMARIDDPKKRMKARMEILEVLYNNFD